MMKIAYFSPLPAMRSGIADYSRELLPILAESAEITLFTDQPSVANLPTAPIATYPQRRWEFDLPIYHLGNSHYHAEIYQMACRYPGVMVLHDYVLHHFMATQQYGRELAYCLGAEEGLAVYLGQTPPRLYETPLNQRPLDLALGVIVHSEYVAKLIREAHPDLPLAVIPQLMPLGEWQERPPVPIFASVGQVIESKQLGWCLKGFGRFWEQVPTSQYWIMGESVDVDVAALIAQLPAEAQKQVIWHGYTAELADFQQLLAQVDVVFNVRYPTAGETSAAALRALAHAKPIIVFDLGWYSELPNEVGMKIRPMDEDGVVQAMHTILQNYAQFARNAHHYIEMNHAPKEVAQQYALFLRQICGEIGK